VDRSETIARVHAREVLDSRGNPTVEVEVHCPGGWGRSIVPSGVPLPMVNLISGGLHAGGNLDFQDFFLLPAGARSFSDALEMTVAVYRALGAVLTQHGFEGVLVGDEGGYGPRLKGNEHAVEMVLKAVETAGYVPGRDAALALDVASTQFYRDGRYHLRGCAAPLASEEMVRLLERWADAYPIWSVEDAGSQRPSPKA
jgi:enolase